VPVHGRGEDFSITNALNRSRSTLLPGREPVGFEQVGDQIQYVPASRLPGASDGIDLLRRA
jgi:hypothetical protein